MKIFSYIFAIFLFAGPKFILAQNISEPINLGSAVNSEYEELCPVMSGDGTKLFFVRMNHPENRFGKKNSQDVWFSEKDSAGNWTEAVRLSDEVNVSRYNAVFWANETGTEIIVSGVFNRSGKMWKERGLSAVSRKDNGKWGRPEPIKIKGLEKRNDGNLTSAFLSQDESLLVLSFSPTNFGRKSDIYISKKKRRKYSKPKKIRSLSSRHQEQATFLSEDGTTLYCSITRDKNSDIYVAKREGNSLKKWLEPVPVNLDINTPGWESYFRLINDGRSALYVSDQNSLGQADIFRIDIETPQQEEKTDSLITFSGVIKDTNGIKLPVTHFRLIVDSVETDYINQSADSAAFEVSLSPKEKYQVTAQMAGYVVDTVYLLAENRDLNLYDIELTATPKVPAEVKQETFILYGGIFDKKTQSALPADVLPDIRLNNAAADSVNYDSLTGKYRISFSTATGNPVLNVVADGYQPFAKAVYPNDSVTGIQMDIYLVEKTSAVTVTGRILNAKTNAPVEDLQGLSIVVNGAPDSNMVYAQEEKTYRIILEKGKKYTVEPQLKGYFGISEMMDLTAAPAGKIEKDLLLTPVEVGQSVKLENIFFKTGSSQLLDESMPELRRVSDFLKNNPTVVIEIGGHSDNVGSDAFNMELSEERAKSVARYIILSGVPRERIQFKGYGETQPLVSNETAEGREQNRRVEFKVLEN